MARKRHFTDRKEVMDWLDYQRRKLKRALKKVTKTKETKDD